MEEFLRQTKPTVGSLEVNKPKRFEHPAVSVLRGKEKPHENEQEKKSQEIEQEKKPQETSVLRKEPKKTNWFTSKYLVGRKAKTRNLVSYRTKS